MFISSTTKEMILFLPSLDHQDSIFSARQNANLLRCLVQGFSVKPDQGKKKRKRRMGKLSLGLNCQAHLNLAISVEFRLNYVLTNILNMVPNSKFYFKELESYLAFNVNQILILCFEIYLSLAQLCPAFIQFSFSFSWKVDLLGAKVERLWESIPFSKRYNKLCYNWWGLEFPDQHHEELSCCSHQSFQVASWWFIHQADKCS